jgi:DNA-directed RNA polymerase subunit N (RpoN/RPB10)
MNCGFTLADKWLWYQARIVQLRKEMGVGAEVQYITGKDVPDTPERRAMDELGVTRYCCRKVLLTHRDLLEKI